MTTNGSSKDKVLDKIRKLLALANSPNEHEATLAAQRAHALLAEHNLSMSEVVVEDTDDTGDFTQDYIESQSHSNWRGLATMVAKLYFCKHYFTTYSPKPNKRVDMNYFVGAAHNIEVAKLMFGYLQTTVERLAREGARGLPTREQSPYRVSFRTACTARLCHRIQYMINEAKKGEMKTSDGRNLPAVADLYQRTEQQLKKYMDENVGGLRSVKSRSKVLHAGGMRDGSAAGDRISLNNQIGGKGSRHLLK